jgi:serine/threonine protein kinase
MLTKKKTATKRKNTTRKIPPFEKLPKKRGSRIFSMETYKINCGKNKLYDYKSPEETSMDKNDFVHLVLSKLQDYDKPVVVKVYDTNSLQLLLEKKILEKIRGYRNIARLICEFSCDDNKNNYITKLTRQIKFYERETNKLYFFVYEYIAHGDISDYLKKTQDIKIVKTLILQMVCVIIELATIYKVWRSYLNSGNILIDKTDEKNIEYKIGDEVVVIESNGIIPKIIDFGRCKFYNQHIIDNYVWHDIIMAISLIEIYANNDEVKQLFSKNKNPYELSLPSIKDYYFYVRDTLYPSGDDM